MGDDIWYGSCDAPDTYRYVCDLGRGGEGLVVEAERRLGSSSVDRVAIKIMKPTRDQDSAIDWWRRGDLLRSLDHRGIIRVRDVFLGPRPHAAGAFTIPDPGTEVTSPESDPAELWRYVVMSKAEGLGLHDWLDRRLTADPAMSFPERMRPLQPIADALDEMHLGSDLRSPVVHGDVKPANIIVDSNGRSVLVDLGLTRLTDGTGGCGRTPPYAAPELCVPGAVCTPETDRFAFIATVVHLVLGQTPPATNEGPVVDEIHKLLLEHPIFANRPRLAGELTNALRAAPQDRPDSMQQWLHQITDSATVIEPHGRPSPAAAAGTPPRPGSRPSGRLRRQLADPAWLSLAALSAAGSGAALWTRGHHHLEQVVPVAVAIALLGYLAAVGTAAWVHPGTAGTPGRAALSWQPEVAAPADRQPGGHR